MTGLELHIYDQLEQAKGWLQIGHMHRDPGQGSEYDLEEAAACRENALKCLSLALGFAKRARKGYAAGRILTAIQWAKLVKLPVQS